MKKDIFFFYEWNNILHTTVEEIFIRLLKSKNDEIIKHVNFTHIQI